VAKNRQYHGETLAGDAFMNRRCELRGLDVRTMHCVGEIDLRHGDANDRRANESMRVYKRCRQNVQFRQQF